ncbi:Gfo/Idh/MocA family oxidoreductase [Bacillus sp. ISL-40]|uniref:Gfo/Idh/MocA family protein n=1 Tax=unclassified Bacillus (in: firmicutes) TaxID=185979 RepID=UPI001BE87171|nr:MULTISPECIES: Gfo/Idh/MocA family oxidoreductase [unclassified Bacillus (in: firmicutes)]MBT2699943.1 Gfo/Idh/MocA family oxidoreductase [Bacillus sp. ISL-40]MBT2722962.1 Gfo/Idh/MocA family oxidoreductase [Bacillus sp. ISL-46]MBT2743752.1 Gfo/Idh/MocA family oxidoreductase [Bacillus sp. ISL-77]
MGLVKVGVIGIGNMGSSHVQMLDQGQIKGAALTAICSRNESRIEWVKNSTKGNVQIFQDEETFFNESGIDAVLIATPHYSHPELAKKAFAKGIHVLIEKPAGVYTKDVLEMNEASKSSGKVFGIMYNQRANPLYQKLRDLIHSGELGDIKRINWIVTDIYRPQSYYDSGKWRATWKGEGGGVLLNQALHHLDICQWTTGLLPKSIRAMCRIGKYHDIEVEDDVTAFLEYENGATGVFITSTGEAPGSNRFEVAGDRGQIIVENEELTFYRLTQSEREFNASYTGGFGKPEWQKVEILVKSENANHSMIVQNWIDSIVTGSSLLAPGEVGIKALEISNAIYLSSWLNEMVELPVNPDLYYEKLQEKINTSTFKKTSVTNTTLNVSGTH